MMMPILSRIPLLLSLCACCAGVSAQTQQPVNTDRDKAINKIWNTQIAEAEEKAPKPSGLTELRISDREVIPLPPGDWRVALKTDAIWCKPGKCGNQKPRRGIVLINQNSDSPFIALVIRHPYEKYRSWTSSCYDRKGNMYQDTHGTTKSTLLSICSLGWDGHDLPDKWSHWWWDNLREPFKEIQLPLGSTLHQTEFHLHYINARPYIINLFTYRALIDGDGKTAAVSLAAEKTWTKTYGRALAAGLFQSASDIDRDTLALKFAPKDESEYNFAGAVAPGQPLRDREGEIAEKIRTLQNDLELVEQMQGKSSRDYQVLGDKISALKQLSARLSEAQNQLNFITQYEGIYSAKYKKLNGEIKGLNEEIQIVSRETKADSRSEPNQSVSGRPQTAQTERQMQASAEAERKAREEELAKQQAELERQRAEVARQDAERKEAERLALEAAERERVAKAEAEEQRRIAAEVARKKAERQQAERLAQEAAERERVAKAQAEEQRRRLAEIARQQEELRRQEAAREEAERLAKEAAKKEQLAREAEQRRIAEAAAKVESTAAQLKRLQDVLEKLQAQTATAPSKPATPPLAPRYALVVGNAKYTSVSPLENSVADAKAFAKQLSNLGFKVSLHTDLRERQFNRAVRDFKQQLSEGDEIVFYYAGHGIQVAGTNYLLPTDVGGESIDQIKDEAVELQRVLDSLAEKNTKFTLAVLDACRDNPFKGNKRAIAGRGLAPTSAATGQMIIFSAGAGQQALDNLGSDDPSPNGLFTRVFLKEMVKPGVPIDSMLRKVRREVVRLAKSVGHDQVPALYDQTVGEFFFKPE
jgi:hypothetical protein